MDLDRLGARSVAQRDLQRPRDVVADDPLPPHDLRGARAGARPAARVPGDGIQLQRPPRPGEHARVPVDPAHGVAAATVGAGIGEADARAAARLGLAVTRGLLLDLLASGDTAGTTQAFALFIRLLGRAATPTQPR